MGRDCCVPSLPSIEGHWPLQGAMRATSDVGVCSYCVTVVAFLCFIRLLFIDLLLCCDTVQGNYNIPRNCTGYF